jgi:hypothetical protein
MKNDDNREAKWALHEWTSERDTPYSQSKRDQAYERGSTLDPGGRRAMGYDSNSNWGKVIGVIFTIVLIVTTILVYK